MNRRNPGQLFSAAGLAWLLLLLVLVLNFSIRWRLRDLPLERDEGEYAYAGQLILQEVPPYKLAWNMKFPGVYFAYAGLMSVFGESPAGLHTGLICVTSLSILLVFLIGRELMGPVGGGMAAALFTLLTLLPEAFGLAGHATHFVVLFVCLGTFALLMAEKKRPLLWAFLAGAAFGVAILMKQQAFVFLPVAMGWQWWQAWQRKEKVLLGSGILLGGVALPLLLTAAAMAWAGVWDRFNFWTIEYARQYVSIFPLWAAPRQFVAGFGPVFNSGPWAWWLGVAGLVLLFLRRQSGNAILPGTGLFLAGMVATAPGFYFRGHYFIMAMPGLALLGAAGLLALAGWVKEFPQIRSLKYLPVCLFLIVAGDLLARNAEIWFRLPPLEVSRRLYGLNPFPESAGIASYIAAHSAPDDTIAVLGSEPQIFFLAHRNSASGYIYVYPLTEPQPLAPVMRQEFIREIETARPKYVVYVNNFRSWYSVITPADPPQVLGGFQPWWNDYSKDYQLVGQVDSADNQPPEFFWDGEMSARTNSAPPGISIFRRN